MKTAEQTVSISVPCKVHLLGEWSVVWGKPALLAAIGLYLTVTLTKNKTKIIPEDLKKIQLTVETVIKKALKIKTIPPYQLNIFSQVPFGNHLGTSAAIAVAYSAAMLSFLKIKWDLNLVNNLAYEVEKVIQGNPSGADNSTIVYGGLMWYRKESPDLKIIQQLPFSIPTKLANNFVFINTGAPKKTTKQMIDITQALFDKKPKLQETFLTTQEQLVRQLLIAIKDANEEELIRITRAGEKNLETIGVVSSLVKPIIRQIESLGGAAKICGAGGKTGPTGVLLAYHKDKSKLEKLAASFNLPFFSAALGVDGLKQS